MMSRARNGLILTRAAAVPAQIGDVWPKSPSTFLTPDVRAQMLDGSGLAGWLDAVDWDAIESRWALRRADLERRAICSGAGRPQVAMHAGEQRVCARMSADPAAVRAIGPCRRRRRGCVRSRAGSPQR